MLYVFEYHTSKTSTAPHFGPKQEELPALRLVTGCIRHLETYFYY